MGTQEKHHLGLLKIQHQTGRATLLVLSRCDLGSPALLAALRSLTLQSIISANELCSGGENWWIHSAESAGTSKEEIIPQAHRFLLDLACCRTNLQLGIAENPQSGELLSKCLKSVVSGGKQVGLRTGMSGFEPSVFHILVLMDLSKLQNPSF